MLLYEILHNLSKLKLVFHYFPKQNSPELNVHFCWIHSMSLLTEYQSISNLQNKRSGDFKLIKNRVVANGEIRRLRKRPMAISMVGVRQLSQHQRPLGIIKQEPVRSQRIRTYRWLIVIRIILMTGINGIKLLPLMICSYLRFGFSPINPYPHRHDKNQFSSVYICLWTVMRLRVSRDKMGRTI